MGFWRAKHGLSKHGLKRPKLVSILRGANREEKRRGREKREEEKKEEDSSQDQAKVWNYDLYHGFYENMYDFPCLYD